MEQKLFVPDRHKKENFFQRTRSAANGLLVQVKFLAVSERETTWCHLYA